MEFTYDIVLKEFKANLPDNFTNILKIGFRKNGKVPVKMHNFNFGFCLTQKNGSLLCENSFSSFKYTDQYILYSRRVNILPNEEYIFKFWVKNTQNKTRDEYIKPIRTLKTTQPHNSWIWDDDKKKWIPPIERPGKDENKYKWDESIQNWREV
jgi:hypothetical protein